MNKSVELGRVGYFALNLPLEGGSNPPETSHTKLVFIARGGEQVKQGVWAQS
jgi:hypothetical protein